MASTPNIHQRMHAAMGEVDYIQKDKKQGMNYTIVSHDVVTAKVRPVLVKHGVIYYPVALQHRQDGNRTEVALTVRFANVDEPTDCIDVVGLGYGVDNQDKGPGKAISYAVKYCLLKALGLETGDDPDHDSIEHQPAKTNGKPASKPAPSTNGKGRPKVTPSEWTESAKDQVGHCASYEDVQEWKGKNAAALAKLESEAPDLHADLTAFIGSKEKIVNTRLGSG